MSTDARRQCGKRLQELREALGLSQAALGKRLQTTQAAVARYEAGLREPDLDRRRLLASVLGSDPYAIEPVEQAS